MANDHGPSIKDDKQYRTPIRGLYLGSAATFPGGAVHGVPGYSAARTALAEARIRRALPERLQP